MTERPFKAGDIVVFYEGNNRYARLWGCAMGVRYEVTRTRDDNDGPHQLVYFRNDNGAEVNSFASRLSLWGTPASVREEQASIKARREERKAAKAARKEKGRARKASMAATKVPLLFTTLTKEDVHAALTAYVRGEYNFYFTVVDIDRTTAGYKLTLGVDA